MRLARVEDLGAPFSTSSYTPSLDPPHAVCCVERHTLTKSDCGGIQFYSLNEQEIRCIGGLNRSSTNTADQIRDFVSFDLIFGDGRLNKFAWDCYVQISHAKSGDLGHPAGRRPSHQSWPLCVGHWEDAPPVAVDSPPLHPADRGPGPP